MKITSLIAGAVAHSSVAGELGEVTIELPEEDPRFIMLRVADDPSNMKRPAPGSLWSTKLLLGLAIVCAFAPRSPAAGPVVLKFKVGTSIVAQSSLNLDHPLLRNNPAVRLLVTHDFGSAATGAFNDSALGVFYQANSAKSGDWFVTNENRTNLTATSSGGFNVMIAPAVRASATAARADGGFTFLSVAKKKPEARLLITHMVNPFPATTPYGLYLPKNIGVRYFEGPLAKRTHDVWAVFNEDLSSAIAAAYNVLDVTAHPHSSIQTSSSGNTSGNHMALDDPVANNNPNALIFVTHLGLDSPGSDTFDHAVGVFYDSTISRWCIYREDNATMPPNIAFVVDVFEAGSP